MTQPISLLICALGGEGGGLLSEWLMNTARLAGYPAQSTSGRPYWRKLSNTAMTCPTLTVSL